VNDVPVYLTDAMLGRFITASEERGDREHHLYLKARFLAWWKRILDSIDLASITDAKLRELVDTHEPRTGWYRYHKLTIVRAFINWTRGSEQKKGNRFLAPTIRREGEFPTGKGWHLLRHTFASHCVMRGYNLRQVQVWMGHSTITVTERYAHLAPTEADVLDDLAEAAPQSRTDLAYAVSDDQKVLRLADFQSRNSAVARPDLVAGPVFKTGGGR